MQIALKAFAVTAVGVFKHRQLALAVSPHDGEGVLEGQAVELDGRELVHPLFGQVAVLFGVIDVAHHQVVTLGVGVIDFGAVDADFIQAGQGRLADFVNRLELGKALGDVFADQGFLGQAAG